MKKWVLTAALVAGLFQPAWAQRYKGDIVLTLQGGIGTAVGTFSHDFGIAPEFMAQVDFALADGTAIGLRGGYRNFGADDESPLRGNMQITNLNLQGKQMFTPDNRFGLYAMAGWGVYWWKEKEINDLSNAEWGGFGGLGFNYELSDRVAFIGETAYNGFFSDPSGISYFSFNLGFTIGLREE